jgi:hypothetical protein
MSGMEEPTNQFRAEEREWKTCADGGTPQCPRTRDPWRRLAVRHDATQFSGMGGNVKLPYSVLLKMMADLAWPIGTAIINPEPAKAAWKTIPVDADYAK